MAKKQFTYKESGVDIKAGEELVNSIKGIVKETHSDAVLSNIGGFGGFFRPNLEGFKKPTFVSSVDGVGTKLIVAFKAGKYDTVGQDLVNHCVNDIADRWDTVAPGAVLSYKRHLGHNKPIPKGGAIVSCHGYPRPHQVNDKWVKELWK